jgi:hypothetical protein
MYRTLSACVVCAAACSNASVVQNLVTDAVLGSVYPGTTTLGAGAASRTSFEMKDVWDLRATRTLIQIFTDNLVPCVMKPPLHDSFGIKFGFQPVFLHIINDVVGSPADTSLG